MKTAFIPGTPPTITNQSKGVRCIPDRGTMRPMFYKKKAYRQAEAHYLSHIPQGSPFSGPVGMRIAFQWPWRVAEPKKNRVLGWKPKDTKPDLDNSAKCLIDCIEKMQFGISHDAQIAELTIVKTWGDDPGVLIQIWELEDGLWLDRSEGRVA